MVFPEEMQGSESLGAVLCLSSSMDVTISAARHSPLWKARVKPAQASALTTHRWTARSTQQTPSCATPARCPVGGWIVWQFVADNPGQ